MLIYILKSVGCMALFLLFYKLLLERENMHVFKRFYLLLALVASLVIPSLVFTEYVIVDPAPLTEQPNVLVNESSAEAISSERNDFPAEENALDVAPLLWVVYGIGMLFFALRFIKNLRQIVKRIHRNPKQRSARFIQVLLQENFPPHTFFKYIFLNRRKLEANEIPKAVLLHEETHARQRHSWDVLFIELLQVVFWFNPLVYLFQKSIKLNHEFLADQAVLNKDIDKITYQNTLLSYLSPDSQNKYQSKMANAINYSSIKKRFTIMKKQTSKKATLVRSSLVIPLLALLLVGFTETRLIKVKPTDSIEIMQKASPQEMEQYTELARKYNAMPIEERVIPLADVKVLERIYQSMTTTQRQGAEPFPECLPQNSVEKKVTITVRQSQIHVDEETVALPALVTSLDQLTQSWEETDYTSAHITASFSDTPPSFLKQVETEFGKTHLSKANSNRKLFPEGQGTNRPQDGASRELMREYNALARHYNEMPRNHMRIKSSDVERLKYIYSLMSDKQKADAEPFPEFPEPPAPPKSVENPKPPLAVVDEVPSITEPKKSPKAPKAMQAAVGEMPAPPMPPEPQSPLDHVIEMAKKGAQFYYEGKSISSDEAIELLRNNKDLNIDSRGHRGKNPQVRISKSPIRIH